MTEELDKNINTVLARLTSGGGKDGDLHKLGELLREYKNSTGKYHPITSYFPEFAERLSRYRGTTST